MILEGEVRLHNLDDGPIENDWVVGRVHDVRDGEAGAGSCNILGEAVGPEKNGEGNHSLVEVRENTHEEGAAHDPHTPAEDNHSYYPVGGHHHRPLPPAVCRARRSAP